MRFLSFDASAGYSPNLCSVIGGAARHRRLTCGVIVSAGRIHRQHSVIVTRPIRASREGQAPRGPQTPSQRRIALGEHDDVLSRSTRGMQRPRQVHCSSRQARAFDSNTFVLRAEKKNDDLKGSCVSNVEMNFYAYCCRCKSVVSSWKWQQDLKKRFKISGLDVYNLNYITCGKTHRSIEFMYRRFCYKENFADN